MKDTIITTSKLLGYTIKQYNKNINTFIRYNPKKMPIEITFYKNKFEETFLITRDKSLKRKVYSFLTHEEKVKHLQHILEQL